MFYNGCRSLYGGCYEKARSLPRTAAGSLLFAAVSAGAADQNRLSPLRKAGLFLFASLLRTLKCPTRKQKRAVKCSIPSSFRAGFAGVGIRNTPAKGNGLPRALRPSQ